ncbi:MAG: J domain-containing protein [Pseudomonadota bacterium]
MAEQISAYPLQWPPNWPRAKRPQKSQFKTSLSGALKNVTKSLELLGSDSGKKVEQVVVSSNVTLGQQNPDDRGVVVYFTWDGISTCIPVDRYTKVEDNLQAIHHCIEADRTKLRHGGIHQIRAAYHGAAQLPPPSEPSASWWSVLGVADDAPPDVVKRAYNRRRSLAHPDKGGHADTFDQVEKAWAQYQEQVG